MIAHALDIVQKELKANIGLDYTDQTDGLVIELGNIATMNVSQAIDTSNTGQSDIIMTLVNMKEEKSLKNLPNYVRNDVTLKATYENPPVFVNCLILFSVICTNYTVALSALSRIVRFFQSKNVFTQDNVLPLSLINAAINEKDRLESFKLIFDLYSPTMEEVNHLWGTLGGKQYPFVMYMMRMLDLKFKAVQSESGLITEVISDFYHKNAVKN